MNYHKFLSIDESFSIQLPENWSEYDDDDENQNTYAFFNSKQWSGNLRISFIHWKGTSNKDKANNYIQSELLENENVCIIKINDRNAAFYSKESVDNNLIYFWITGAKNNLFICSFTVDKSHLETDSHTRELGVVEQILHSIEVL